MRALGFILAGGNSYRMGELTQQRATAAMPVAGCFRSIDFSLSNMTNSRIQKVGVCTQYRARSLNEHLSSSKWWDFGRKQGGLSIFAPTVTAENSPWYRGTADALYQNLGFLKDSHEPYVVIASGDCVYKMDYNKLLAFHIEHKADITVACKDMPGDYNTERFGALKLERDSRIREFDEKPVITKSNTISCGIYVIRRRQLIDLLEQAAKENRHDLVKDILVRYKDQKRIYGYKFSEYWANIATIEDYYRTNMDFLNPDIRKYFFEDYPNIYSKIEDLPPAKYNAGSKVKNALIASGSIINGRVEDSLIFKKAFVGNNCYIKNAIILNDVYIADNSHIENCVVESRATIKQGSYYKGDNEIKVVLEQNQRMVI